MIFRTVALASLLAVSVTAQDEACSVCGEGLEVGFPDGIFTFPGQPAAPCGLLQEAGFNGTIPLVGCVNLPNLIEFVCDCVPATMPTDPPFAPALSPIAPGDTVAPATGAPFAPVTGAPIGPPVTRPPTVPGGAGGNVGVPAPTQTASPVTTPPVSVTGAPVTAPPTMATGAPVTAPPTMATGAPVTDPPATTAPVDPGAPPVSPAPVVAATPAPVDDPTPAPDSSATRMGMCLATLSGVVAFFV